MPTPPPGHISSEREHAHTPTSSHSDSNHSKIFIEISMRQQQIFRICRQQSPVLSSLPHCRAPPRSPESHGYTPRRGVSSGRPGSNVDPEPHSYVFTCNTLARRQAHPPPCRAVTLQSATLASRPSSQRSPAGRLLYGWTWGLSAPSHAHAHAGGRCGRRAGGGPRNIMI